MTRPAPRSVDQYLAQLRESLRGQDPALVQDALYDAEEYLRAELATHPGEHEPDVLERIAATYGAPDEVAEAYRATEATVRVALAPPPPRPRTTLLGRFLAVWSDSRAWTALFYMLLALVTGIFYFVVAVSGLAMSAGLAVLIVGVPFFLLFVAATRMLALLEGRVVEALLGQRMPRRPIARSRAPSMWQRIREMLVDRRTWTTLVYQGAMLPLGVGYFAAATVGLALGFGLAAGAVVLVATGLGLDLGQTLSIDGAPVPVAWAPVLLAGSVLVLTLLLHLARLVGRVHGWLAKALLVAPPADVGDAAGEDTADTTAVDTTTADASAAGAAERGGPTAGAAGGTASVPAAAGVGRGRGLRGATA